MNSSEEKIKELRAKIDELDGKIVELLIQRLDVAASVIEAKKASGFSNEDKSRESLILERLLAKAGKYRTIVGDIYERIFKWVKTGKV